LKLNITKCKVVYYAKRSMIENKYYVTDEGESRYFERVENMKDFGVMFDSELDCQAHIHEKVNKAYSVLGVIKRNFMQLNRETFGNLYKAMVRHIKYANSVWSPFKLTDMNAVEKVQMRVTKFSYWRKTFTLL